MKPNLSEISELLQEEIQIKNHVRKFHYDDWVDRYNDLDSSGRRTFSEWRIVDYIFSPYCYDKRIVLTYIESIRLSYQYNISKKMMDKIISYKYVKDMTKEKRHEFYNLLKWNCNLKFFAMGLIKIKDLYRTEITDLNKYMKLDELIYGKHDDESLTRMIFRVRSGLQLNKTNESYVEYYLYLIKTRVKHNEGYKVVNTIRCMFGITDFESLKGYTIHHYERKFFKWLDLLNDIEISFPYVWENKYIQYKFLGTIMKGYNHMRRTYR